MQHGFHCKTKDIVTAAECRVHYQLAVLLFSCGTLASWVEDVLSPRMWLLALHPQEKKKVDEAKAAEDKTKVDEDDEYGEYRGLAVKFCDDPRI